MRHAAMTLQAALDEIYHWYMAAKPAVTGRFDREVREPVVIVGIARELGLLPPPERTLRVTGSKGKGTVSRTLANTLRRLNVGRVGLLVSPEEFEHTDRMQIGGAEIGEADFLSHYGALRPHLLAAAEGLSGGRYLSPSGIFLLIALAWFKARGVELFVLETGRGAQFDEVGQIPSKVSVVTSVFLEHAGYLGPGLADIAAEKLHIAGTSETVVLGASAADWAHLLPENMDLVVVRDDGEHNRPADCPGWMVADKCLAQAAVSAFLGRDAEVADGDIASAAFQKCLLGGIPVFIEPLISDASVDDGFVDGLVERYGGGLAVVASLPDDKGIDGVVDAFARREVAMHHVVLHGTRGYLNYETVKARFADQILVDVKFDDTDRFVSLLKSLSGNDDCAALYVIGTHTFIRSVKLAVRAMLEGADV